MQTLQHRAFTVAQLVAAGNGPEPGAKTMSVGVAATIPTGKLLFHITGVMAAFERALMSERTKAGMQAGPDRAH